MTDEVLVWLSLEQGVDSLHMVQLMPLPSMTIRITVDLMLNLGAYPLLPQNLAITINWSDNCSVLLIH